MMPEKIDLRPEQLHTEVERIDAVVADMIPEDMPGALGLRAIAHTAIRNYIHALPMGTFKPRFEPDERVGLVPMMGRDGEGIRKGTVVEIDAEPKVHLYLRVRFDDGEERQINPDVMRRLRED